MTLRLRQGQSELLLGALRGGNWGWLARQAAKFVAIQAAARGGGGGTCVGPLMGVLVVVNRCNSRCPMCDIPRRREHDPSTERLLGLIDEFVALGTSGLGLTGGEPLLRPDIFDLVRHARRHRIPVTLNTNGLLLDDERIARLLEAGPTNVNISLDGGSAETHDRLRGGAFFTRTLDGIRRLSAAARSGGDRTRVTVVTVLREENRQELPRIVELVEDSGAHRWGIMPLHDTREGGPIRALPSEPLRGLSAWLLGLERARMDNSPAYIRSLEAAWRGEPLPRRCNAGFTSLFVDSNLRVYPCLGYYMMGRFVARLDEQDATLPSIWRSARYREVRKETLACRMCYLNCQAELNHLVPV